MTWASRAVTAQQQDEERLLAHARHLTATRPTSQEDYEAWARAFVEGEPYFASREFVELVDVGRASVPDWPLHPSDVLSPTGYVLLEQPIHMAASHSGPPVRIRSLTWRTYPVTLVPSKYPTGALTTCWFSVTEPFAGGLSLGFGMTAAESLALEREDYRRWGPDASDRYTAWDAVAAPVLQALLACLKQQIAVMERVRPDRAARKLAERANRPVRDVNIVSLRRERSCSTGSPAEPDIDWATRWWVRGHWRRQACGRGRGNRRPVLIASHIKGPEDKPLAPLRPRAFVAHR